MIKQPHHKTNFRRIILVLVGALVVVTLLVAVLEKTNVTNLFESPISNTSSSANKTGTSVVNYDPPSDEEISIGNEIKKEAEQNSSTSNTNGAISISFSAVAQDEKGGPLVIRTIVGASEGTCNAKVSSANFSQDFSSAIKDLGTYFGCNFDIPVTDIPVGTYTLTLVANSSEATGSAHQQIEVRK